MGQTVEIFQIEQPYEQNSKPSISRVEFSKVNDDFCISFYDSGLMKDGEYSPINIERHQLVQLRSWISFQLEK